MMIDKQSLPQETPDDVIIHPDSFSPSHASNSNKLKPVSAFSLGECSSQDELSKIVFTESPSLIPEPPSIVVFPSSASSTSSTSSASSVTNTCTNKEDSMTSAGVPTTPSGTTIISHDPSPTPKQVSQTFYSFLPNGEKLPIPLTHSSRHGRQNQRWDRCPITHRLIRLTTGCVPITNDGRILFLSAARKKEWILPKGGWESDERMEESAVRESYEEAGILGTLGPRLTEITFETRKGKKRRLERLEQEKLLQGQDEKTHAKKLDDTPTDMTLNTLTNPPQSQPMPAIGDPKPLYEMCRMTLFPLYVSDVLEEWPENGRTRKIFSIDEAIEMVTRDELKVILNEVKRRGLHIASKLARNTTTSK